MKKMLVAIFMLLVTGGLYSQMETETGRIDLNAGKYFIQVMLVSDPNRLAKEWDNSNQKTVPGVKPRNKFKIGETVAPFIFFALLSNSSEKMNLKCNYSLMKPDNSVSVNNGKDVKIVNELVKPKMFFRSASIFGWTFDETDPIGKYQVNIQLFDDKDFKKDITLFFELEK